MWKLKIERVWIMPNKHTFLIPPVRDLINKYAVGEENWVDPFAGWNSPATITNDFNLQAPTTFHLDAFDFSKELAEEDILYDGCLFDPPYSLEQIKRSYDGVGLKSKLGYSTNGAEDPTGNWKKVKDNLTKVLKSGGIVISFGWNTSGFGKGRGFEIVEILILCHGGNHNDTLVTVERKVT